jgi:preprotein translocase subunit YajC
MDESLGFKHFLIVFYFISKIQQASEKRMKQLLLSLRILFF